jgi:recombination protein RecT
MNAVTEPRRSDFVPLARITNLRDALAHPQFTQRLAQACAGQISPERMLRVANQAIMRTPNLKDVPIMELLGAITLLASVGLEPNTPLGHAHMIPFAKRKKVYDADSQREVWKTVGYRVEIVIGYSGYIALAYRSGQVSRIHADVVYEGDEFSFEYGSNAHLRHIPKGDRNRKPLFAYCHAKLEPFGEEFMVWPWEQVLLARNNSQGYQQAVKAYNKNPKSPAWLMNPWVAHPHPMAAKTMVRAIRNYIPMSLELVRAMAIETAGHKGVDFSDVFQIPAGEEIDASYLPERDMEQDDHTEESPQREETGHEEAKNTDENSVPARDEQAVESATTDEIETSYALLNGAGKFVSAHVDIVEWAIAFADLSDLDGFDKLRDANFKLFEEAVNDTSEGGAKDIIIQCQQAQASQKRADEEDQASLELSGNDQSDGEYARSIATIDFAELPRTRSNALDHSAILSMVKEELEHGSAAGDVSERWSSAMASMPASLRLKILKILSAKQ